MLSCQLFGGTAGTHQLEEVEFGLEAPSVRWKFHKPAAMVAMLGTLSGEHRCPDLGPLSHSRQ